MTLGIAGFSGFAHSSDPALGLQIRHHAWGSSRAKASSRMDTAYTVSEAFVLSAIVLKIRTSPAYLSTWT